MTGDVASEKASAGSGSAADALSIDRLDVIAPGAFAAAVAPLFEGARGFLGRLAVARPFGSVEGFFDTARLIAHAMPVEEQIELIDAHPRLGASPGSVSALSFAEQGYDRGGTERAHETTVAAVIREWASSSDVALEEDRAAELARALDAVIDIARDRYATMTSASSEAAT